MRVKILTLKYSDRLDGFDTSEIDDFVKDKDLLEIRDHVFLSGGSPRCPIQNRAISVNCHRSTSFSPR